MFISNVYLYVLNNPVNWIDPWGLYSFRQGLKDTGTYAWVFAAYAAFIPAWQPAAVVFAGIGFGTTVLELAIYSEDPFWEGIREVIKMLIPIKNPFLDKAKDEAIDRIYDSIENMKDDRSQKQDSEPCP